MDTAERRPARGQDGGVGRCALFGGPAMIQCLAEHSGTFHRSRVEHSGRTLGSIALGYNILEDSIAPGWNNLEGSIAPG